MFHYKNYGKTGKCSKAIVVGDFVRSRYRRRWYGKVTHLESNGGIATVQPLFSHRGAPMLNKPYIKRLHVNWLEVIPIPEWARETT